MINLEMNKTKIVIEEVSYLPNGTFNLSSLTQLTSKGWIMGGNNKSIWIEKGCNMIVFDWMIPATNWMLFAMNLTRDTKNTDETKSLKAIEGRKNIGFELREGAKNESKKGIRRTKSEIKSKIESKIKTEIVIFKIITMKPLIMETM
jgi:hypothetical protein